MKINSCTSKNLIKKNNLFNNVIDEFYCKVKASPMKIAIKDDFYHINYQDLDNLSTRLAIILKSKGISAGEKIGICMSRSIQAIILMLAVLKVNCTYVLLSIDFPLQKIKSISDNLLIKLLVHDSGVDLSEFNNSAKYSTLIDSFYVKDTPLEKANDIYPMYCILTSGTTGAPKSVAIWQSSVLNLVKNNNYIHLSEDDVFLNLSSLIFDGSIFEIWGALLNGATLVIMPVGYPDLSIISKKINEEKISVLFITTKLFNSMVNNRLDDLIKIKKIIFGGELASELCVNKFLMNMGDENYLANIYGPTESTTFSLFFPITTKYDFKKYPKIPIGIAINGAETVLVNDKMECIFGEGTGELLIGGAGLGQYVFDNDLNEEKFIRNQFSHISSNSLFRTGDIVERNKDGNYIFIGRNDRMIKVRGFRVHLEEIEKVAASFTGVENAVVLHEKNGDVDTVVLAIKINENIFEEEKLIEYFKIMLPDYMRPNKIFYGEIPVNDSGKIDFNLLNKKIFVKGENEAVKFPEKKELKRIIREIWQQELPNIVFSDDDDFLDIGGNSLMLINILDKLQRRDDILLFSKNITVIDLFDHSTIDNLANFITESSGLK